MRTVVSVLKIALLIYTILTLCFGNNLVSNNSLSGVIALAGNMASLLTSNSSMEWDLSPNHVDMYIRDATLSLGLDFKYDATTFDELELKQFLPHNWETNDQKLIAGSNLDELITIASAPLRLKGESAEQLRTSFRQQSGCHKVIDILNVGQRICTGPDFRPNGGVETSNSMKYNKMRPICNNAMLKLVEKGRAIVFSKDALLTSNRLRELVVNRLTWAPKSGDCKGRTCVDSSTGSINHPSLNDSMNTTLSDALYPKRDLPTLHDIAELACEQRRRYPGKQLSGATMDVSLAYNQFPQSIASAKQHAVQLKVDIEGGGTISLIAIILVGAFGDKIAGDIYNQIGNLLDEKHNIKWRRSLTYIDDAAFIDTAELLPASVDEYKESVYKVFGNDDVLNDIKYFTWEDQLVAIGQ